ncbi:radical SAM protein [Methylobrevis albus]|uniref:Radical SAM protein n=1 Tax=Methylobrevis albus TaxID=2793297 RepID=A0A931MXR5_9HYPH|nr:radical SAM protein [Methylobrevis albus]MBH0239528.1 radical SAM protein [Methylobrevis albus]
MAAPALSPASVAPTLPAEQALLDARFADLARAERLLPLKVTAFYQAKIDEEVAALGHTEGPLHRTAHPTRERFAVHAGHEVADWVDDRSNMRVTGSDAIIHKYPDRVLFMPTSLCAGHCQYCFRQDVLTEQHEAGRTRVAEELGRLVAYLGTVPEVREVILSGGDPLTLPLRDLKLILETLRALPRRPAIRIHTRALAFAPRTFADPAKLDLLAAADVRLVFHFVHPYEICDAVRGVLRELRRRDVRLYNHFPLLRGVNDHAAVIARLVEDLDDARVRTLSVYVPEPIRYSAPYRMPLDRVFAIQDALTTGWPGWANAIRFTLDSPVGKVRREHIVARDRAAGTVTFRREGQSIVYPDFPAMLDVAGDPATMLWRG